MKSLRLVAVLGVLVLGGCASVAPPSQPRLFLVPAYISSAPSAPSPPPFVEAAALVLSASGRFSLRQKGWFESGFDEAVANLDYPRTALLDDDQRAAANQGLRVDAFGLTDLVADPAGRLWRVHFRIVDANTGAVLEAFSAEIPWGTQDADLASAVAALSRPHPVEPPDPEPRLDRSGAWEAWWALAPPLTGEAPLWRDRLDKARASGNFAEALRLADLILGQTKFAGDDQEALTARERQLLRPEEAWVSGQGRWLRDTLDREARGARDNRDFRALMLALLPASSPGGSEALAADQFLDLARQTLLTSSAAWRPEVTAAFRRRFGVDLAVALTRPAMVLVEGGSFAMGSQDGEADERPVHRVTVTGFLMGRTPVTQEQYQALMGTNPSLFTRGADANRQPVERVTWFDAVEFCVRLSLQQGLEPVYTLSQRRPARGFPIVGAVVTEDPPKGGYRLPTEAEREWAARGGILGRGALLAGSNDPAVVAWTDGSTGPHPVASKVPNELGLFDMSGNVWEWCWDWYGKYPADAQTDPRGPGVGILRVGRGGSWHAAAWNSRTTARSFDNPGSRGGNIGFRVVLGVNPASGN